MDPQTQAMVAALMGGQNAVQPSQVAQQPDPSQFNPQQLMGQTQGMSPNQQQGMFSQPYGGQASQQMYPLNYGI